MILVVYANQDEGKHIRHRPLVRVGQGAKNFYFVNLRDYDRVILFGSCGALIPVSLNDFIVEENPADVFRSKFVCVDHPIHTKKVADQIRCERPHAIAVEMESWPVLLKCLDQNIPLTIVKYPIDFCDQKAMPRGINHFWRKYQMWRMQRKFDEYMKALDGGA